MNNMAEFPIAMDSPFSSDEQHLHLGT